VTPFAAMVGRLLDSLEASSGGTVVVRWTDGRSGPPGPAWDHSVERMLVSSAAAGDDDALDLLICREWCGVYRLVSRREPDAARAEELVQEVFTRAIASLGRLQQLGVPFRSYLAQIAHRLMRERIGAPTPDGSRGGPGVFGGDDTPGLVVLTAQERTVRASRDDEPTVVVLSAEERPRFLELLDRLPRRSRELLWLRVLEGRTEAEIGIAWGRSAGAVHEAQHQALTALRMSLIDHPEGPT
jgi:RNA polymerase sigma-70 factor (ECF subfamily)